MESHLQREELINRLTSGVTVIVLSNTRLSELVLRKIYELALDMKVVMISVKPYYIRFSEQCYIMILPAQLERLRGWKHFDNCITSNVLHHDLSKQLDWARFAKNIMFYDWEMEQLLWDE